MAVSVEQFGKALVASGLMTAEEVQGAWNALPAGTRPKDGDGFAKLLTRLGTITDFQAEQVLAGKGTSLVLGDYVMLSKIGAGGMGQVFKARHRRMKRVVAIKLLPAAVVKDAAAVKRFEREVEAAARLTHPNIVAALDARAEKGVHYLVMECVEGRDLSAIVKERGPLPVTEAVDYIRQAACGLAYAHSEGVVHRDIKPANLLLDKKGTVKILDMGLARFDESGDAADHQLTNTGQVMGTVDYMAPEQAQDTHAADARSDIYSLGCSLYRLLVGESVFHAETVVKKILAHMNAPIPSLVAKRPDVPAEVDRIFQRMMAKQPEDRYQTMDEVVAALSPFAPGAASSTGVTSPGGATDTNLTNFLQSLGGAAATSRSQVLPSKTSVSPEQTLARVNPEVGTDPKSELSLGVKGSGVRGQGSVIQAAASPVNRDAKRSASSRGKQPPLLWIAAGGGGILAALLGVIVIVYGPDGEEVARVKVPDGGSVEMKTGEPRPLGSGTVAPRTTPPLPDGRGSSGMSPLATLLLSSDYVWSEPENLGPNVNGPNNDYLISLTNDEHRLFLHGNDAAGRHRYGEAVRNSPADAFGKLQSVSSISTDAYVGGDGLTAVAIIRGESSTHDIMLQRRPKLGDPWDKGVNLGPQVNSPANERLPTLSPDGLTLLFSTSRRANTANDLWVSRRKSLADPFGPAASVGPPVNSEFTPVRSGVLLGDGQTILFNRGDKLHIAFTGPNGGRAALELENHPFAPESSGPLNVWLAPDGRTAYFTADRPGGVGGKDIWVTRRVPKGATGPSPLTPGPSAVVYLDDLTEKSYDGYQKRVYKPGRNADDATILSTLFPGELLVHALRIHPNNEGYANKKGTTPYVATLTYELTTPFDRFHARVRANERAYPVYAELWGDGKKVWESSDLASQKEATVTVDVDIRGVRELQLIARAEKRAQGSDVLWLAPRLTPVASSSPPAPSPTIPAEALTFNGHRYLLVEGHATWDQANAKAKALGGHLATITDKSEDDFLRKQFLGALPAQRLVWIGAQKPADSLTWSWVSGEPWSYESWFVGEGEEKTRGGGAYVNYGARGLGWGDWPPFPPPIAKDGSFAGQDRSFGFLVEWDTLGSAALTTGGSTALTSHQPPATSNSPNTALKFDGDDLVEIPSLTFDSKGSYTLEGYITSPASADKGAGLAFGMPEQSYLSFTRQGDWRWVYSPKSRDHGTDIAIAGAPARQERTHIACVRNGQSHRLYVDGKLFSKTAEIPSPAQGASPFRIGEELRGVVDELRVSKVARYTAEFTPAGRFEPDADTLGLYHFDEAAGDVLKDSSGNNRHGKITGATWVKADGTPTMTHEPRP